MIPGIAKSWRISKDQKTYTFYLRKHAKWSNGKPLTAEDFKYGITRCLDPKVASVYSYMFYPIVNGQAFNAGKVKADKVKADKVGVKVINPHTIQFRLNQPTPYFLTLLAQPTGAPAYKPSIEKWGDEFTRPGHLISDGSYMLPNDSNAWVVNDHITVVKNPYYWDRQHVQIGKVIYKPLTNRKTAISMYQSGDIDWLTQVPSDQYRALSTSKKYKSQLRVAPWLALYYYAVNFKRAPFNHLTAVQGKDLRQALSLAIDRETITQDVLGQGQLPAYFLVPRNTNGIEVTH